ncbi:hypothetical protein [Microbispora sp. NPDC049125]|uniref:hypothetical protein n=1 Tax=Microbispora sp. NPDC049125 TaxID=3154929 RepID=UPI003466513A
MPGRSGRTDVLLVIVAVGLTLLSFTFILVNQVSYASTADTVSSVTMAFSAVLSSVAALISAVAAWRAGRRAKEGTPVTGTVVAPGQPRVDELLARQELMNENMLKTLENLILHTTLLAERVSDLQKDSPRASGRGEETPGTAN